MADSTSETLDPKIDPEDQFSFNVNDNGLHEPHPEEPDDDEPPPSSKEAELRSDRAKLEGLFHQFSTEKVGIRVHDVVIKGNTRTKEYLIEAELEGIKKATTVQELLEALTVANAKLRELGIFDAVRYMLDSGPPELPGTANVIVEVDESESTVIGDAGCKVLYVRFCIRFCMWLTQLPSLKALLSLSI